MHAIDRNGAFPAELLDAPVWCVAGPDEDGKHKIPVNPYTRENASVSDPSTWGTFEDACATAIEMRYFLSNGSPAVGHVLRIQDGIFVIDFDKGYQSREVWQTQCQLLELFDTYVEESQSGQGLHAYARGFLFKGKRFKSASVEIYGHQRFIVATGEAIDDSEMSDHSLTLPHFLAQHAPPEAQFFFNDSAPFVADVMERLSENTFIVDAFLTPGGYANFFADRSIADSVFMKEILRKCPNHIQALEVFSQSPMGQRAKWYKREDYRRMTLEAAALEVERDMREEAALAQRFLAACVPPLPEVPVVPPAQKQELPKPFTVADAPKEYNALNYLPPELAIRVQPVRMILGITEQIPSAQHLLQMKPYPSGFYAEGKAPWLEFEVGKDNPHFMSVPLPGFLGELAAQISGTFHRPSIRIAELAALQIAQMCIGRGAATDGSGLNTYHMMTGPSGIGKSTARGAVISFLSTLASRYDLRAFSVIDKPKSREGLHGAIMRADAPQVLVTVDEAQKFLADVNMGAKTGGVASGIATLLTDAYDKSDLHQKLLGSEASKQENSTQDVERPFVALNMFGIHDEMISNLTRELLSNGFMSRLLITHVRYEDVAENMQEFRTNQRDFPSDIYERCAHICRFFASTGSAEAIPFEVHLPPHVRRAHTKFSDWAYQLSSLQNRPYFNRASLNALKLASIVAIFNDPRACVVTEELYFWAARWVLCSLNVIEGAIASGHTGDTHEAMRRAVTSRLMLYYQTYPTESARRHAAKELGLTPDVAATGLVPLAWLQKQVSAITAFRQGFYANPSRNLQEILKVMDGNGELGFYHQDHKGRFEYMSPNGKRILVKASLIECGELIRLNLRSQGGEGSGDEN